ncbi:acyltransferase domain-containing protein [Actinosynnema sp. NPDC051121]
MRSVALLLPGQGAQRAGMAAALYGRDEVFTASVDEVFDALGRDGDDLRADWLSDTPRLPVDHVLRSQPLLFAVNLGYARVALSWGLRPSALLGHSAGEVVAAVLAGVFPLREAAALMWRRMTRLAGAPAGGMLAVSASPDALAPFLRADVVVGALNAPRQTVLAGSAGPLREVAAALAARDFTCNPVASLTPFHSPALAGFVDEDHAEFRDLAPRPPEVTIHSCYTGRVLGREQATDPAYWASHPVAPVLFWPALADLLATGDHLLLEAGPGQGLTRLARRHPAVRAGRSRVVPLSPAEPGDEVAALARARAVVEAALSGGTEEEP